MMKKLLCTLFLIIASIGFVQAQAEINVQGNTIDIVDGDTTPSTADGTDFGQINTGASSSEQLFVIQNTGDAALTITVAVTDNPLFAITTAPASSIPASGSTNIGITYNAPVTAEITNTTLFIFSTDGNADEIPYDFSLTAEAIAPTGPEINVTGNGISIVGNGTNTPNTADGTDFGQVAASTSSVEQIFVIQNLGTSDLTLNPSFTTNPVFSITTPATSPVPAGSSVNIGITFNAPATPGVVSAFLFITNGDPDENPYQINLTAESVGPPDPEINVTGNGINIIGDGSNTPNVVDGTDFGQIDVSTSSTEQIFVIENNGTSALSVNPSFTTNPAFAITTSAASSVPAGGTTTIGITFNAPATSGVINAILFINNSDSDENPYQINLTAEAIVPTNPEINVTGNGITIIGDGTNSPNTSDGTDFGQVVATTSSSEQIFVIENTGTAPLIVNPSVTTNPAFTITTAAVSPIAPSGSTTIGITFNAPATAGVVNAVLFITNSDSDENPYQINLTAESVIVTAPEMDVFGNGVEIADGDTTPSTADDTDFGQADVTTGTVSRTFTIENNGSADLNLTDSSPFVTLTGDTADFIVTARPSTPIAASGSTTFIIVFDPTSLGVKTAVVSIANDDADENPYTFTIQGEGIDGNAGTPLLITQYHEGIGSDQWIEVKNISQNTVIAGSYFLALYQDSNTLEGTIDISAPQQSVAIGTMAPGTIRLFRNPSASLPGSGNLGSAPVTDSNVCLFDGDDVILISTTNGISCYDNRIDIMGVVQPSTGIQPFWGADKGFVKGCGTTESPVTVFDATVNSTSDVDVNDYIELTIDEVNTAISTTNIALGTQGSITTTWTTSWNEGQPDRTRNAIINGTYDASNGSLESCNLIVQGTIDFSGSTTNYVAVNEDLTIVGTFLLGNTASLYTVNATDPANTGLIIGSITKSETTTQLTNINDFTYWSSPVQGAAINSVFSANDLNRVFYWDQSVTNTIPGGGTEVLGEWLPAAGLTMTPGKGYISEGPTSGTYPLQQTITFSGTPNNATITRTNANNDVVFINDGNPENDYNVVGNPYPSAISADAFILDSDNLADIDGTISFWTHNTPVNNDPVNRYSTSDYATYNTSGGTAACGTCPEPDGTIGSAQGFIIRATSTAQRVEFNNAMRLRDQNTQFFRGTDSKKSAGGERDRIWLDMETTDGGVFNQILIGFFDGATDAHDRGYDGSKNSANWVSFYSKIDTLKYGIQGLSTFNVDKQVPLGFETYINETLTYKISISKIEGVLKDNDVYLVDNELNITHDLKQADYEFDVDGVGNYSDRFTLQFTKSSVLGVGDLELNNNFVVINEEDVLRLRASSVITNLKVYDMTGRLLINKKPNDSDYKISTHNIRKGTVLIINATLDNGVEVSKKAIRY